MKSKKIKKSQRTLKNKDKNKDAETINSQYSKKEKKAFLHDLLFKETFSDPEKAVEFFEMFLAPEGFEKLDWSQIKNEKDSLSGKQADLVFSVPIKEEHSSQNETKNLRVLFFLLLEHKSHLGSEVFEQIENYKYLLKKEINKNTKDVFAVVLPFIFYHGKTPWPHKSSYLELTLGSRQAKSVLGLLNSLYFSPYVVNYEVRVIDINEKRFEKLFSDERFKVRHVLRVLKEVWKFKSNPRLMYELVKDVIESRDNLMILSVLEYYKKGLDERVFKDLKESLEKQNVIKGDLMDIRERISKEARQEGLQKGIQEGIQKGIQEGIQKGIQKGILKGIQKGIQKGRQEGENKIREITLNLLKEGIEISLVSKATGLSQAEILDLKKSLK